MKKMSFDLLLGPHAEDEERQCESHNSTTRISSLVCEYCKKVFQGKENLKRHTKNIHENTECFNCDMCEKSYNKKLSLNRHVDVVHKKLRPFKCKDCDKTFTDPTPLKSHINVAHSEKGSHRCLKCNKIFSFDTQLRSHMLRHHGPSKVKVKCDYCSADVWKYDIRAHIRAHINRDHKTYLCQCGKFFATNRLLEKHKLGHEAVEKNFKCETCGLSYKSNAYLLGHIRRIHENSEAGRWLCKICGKEFSQSGGLANHKKSHIGKLFKCLSCDKAYNRNDLLKKHMLTHSGAYKKCNVCNKKLSIYTPLSEHMKTHTGEKPFSCKYCILRTALKENLKRHVKRVHKKEFFD